jgi:hypothetical protein
MSATYSTSLYTPPPIPTGDLANIPDELRPYPNWINWAYRPDRKVPGRWNKQIIFRRDTPRGPRWCWGGPTWPEVLVDFHTALYYALINEGTGRVGVGFCLTRAEDTPFTFTDYDKCHDPATGEVAPWALALVRRLNTFTEVSPSGTGLHQVVLGKKPDTRCHNTTAGVELYDKVHFIAMTGWRLPGTPATVEPRQDELEALYHELFPAPAPRTPALDCDLGTAALRPEATPFRIIPGAADDLINRARQYVCRIPGAISGQHGSARTVHVACKLLLDFALPFDDALTVLREWNETCSPPWTDKELRRRLEWADQQPGPRGRLANAERPRRPQPWEEEIADLINVPVTFRLGHATATPAAEAAPEAAAEAAGDDGARHQAAWEDPRDSDRWAKPLPCPNCRELLMRHRWERDVDVRVVDCHDRACVACRHNGKRKQVLKLRRGIAAGDTVHVCTVPEWSRKVWAALPGTYARVKRTSAGLRVGELVISLGGPPQGLESQPMTGADALALAEANVAAYAEAGWVVSTSQDWPRDDEPDSATGCWQVIGERSRDLPQLTRTVMRQIARDNGATLEDPPGDVPERLRHRFRAIHRFHYPSDWDDARVENFIWQLSLGESLPDVGPPGAAADEGPPEFAIDLSAENFCSS